MIKQKKSGKTSRFLKTVLAFIVTLLPIVMIIFSAFFSHYDPRKTHDLTPIQSSTEAIHLFNEPLLTVTFDDGPESVYSEGARILEKYGIPTTQYILSGTFEDYNYLSHAQVKSLLAAGHDIQSHTITHPALANLSEADVERELKQSRDDISTLIGLPVTEFAAPLNSYNDQVVQKIKQHYRSHRNTISDILGKKDIDFNTPDIFDVYSINGYSVRHSTTAEQVKNYIEAAKQRNAWIVLIYHEVEPSTDSYYNVHPDEFDRQMKAIKDSGIRVVTMKQAVDTYYKGAR